MAIKDIGFIG